jgi:hypothetical protein
MHDTQELEARRFLAMLLSELGSFLKMNR